MKSMAHVNGTVMLLGLFLNQYWDWPFVTAFVTAF